MTADPNAPGPPPGNPSRSRDHFRWDERHHQPHTDMGKWEKFFASRADAGQFLRLLGRNAARLGPVARRYRALLRAPAAPQPIAGSLFGVAVSPRADTWSRQLDRIRDLGVRALLIRVPAWAPEPVFALHDQLARLHDEGVTLTFTLLQNRELVKDPERWRSFARAAAACLGDLEPTFQLGHAVNRKKWGVWHPNEYVRLLEHTAAVRDEFPAVRWIGPPVIDFEYYFTTHYLAGPRPFDFDGIAALLYVDRRGSPDNRQYGHFDLYRKILLLRAVIAVSGHPEVPIHLTEFNWPLLGSGKHSPAGEHVQTDEERQARYLAIYDLTAAATGEVASVFWWQLVARGYGLLDEDAGWTERRAYRAFRHLLARGAGRTVRRLPEGLRPLRGFLLHRDASTVALLYASGGEVPVDPALAVQVATSLTGEPRDPASLAAGPDPVYLELGAADPAAVLDVLADSSARARRKS